MRSHKVPNPYGLSTSRYEIDGYTHGQVAAWMNDILKFVTEFGPLVRVTEDTIYFKYPEGQATLKRDIIIDTFITP